MYIKQMEVVKVFINLNLRLEVNGDINLTALVHEIEKLELNKEVLIAILKNAQEDLIDKLCEQGYVRNGTKPRTLKTTLGKVSMRVQRVRSNKGRSCIPFLSVLGIEGKERYTRDIKMESADSAIKLTYRDAEEEVRKRGIKVSRSRIHKFVQEVGPKIREENQRHIEKQNIVMADGTKAHGMGKKNEINVVIGRDLESGAKTLLNVSVNRSWEDVGRGSNRHIGDDALLVADAEKAIRNTLKKAEFQMDIRHVISEVYHKLWEHGAPKETRKEILTELKAILYTLKSSVEKHVQDRDMDRLQWRIDKTLDDLKKLAEAVGRMGYWKVRKFVKNCANYMVTFARLVISGIKVPYTSNMIERLMGEIAKRVKNKWMHWSATGLENLLNILLVRYCNKKLYKKIWNKYVYGPCKNISIKAQFNVGGVASTHFGT